jgi:RNA polymerase sigma factor (sigma-70 family)
MTSTVDQDRKLSGVFAAEQRRLRSFIRKRVANEADVEDLLQEVFCELVEANRLLKPIDYVTGWLFRVARNRITDMFRRKRLDSVDGAAVENEDGETLALEELLPSSDDGPEALYLRKVLVEELGRALAELPRDQREVFVAHELDGRSFKELSAETGVSVNTLLSRKRYAILRLRDRLQTIHDQYLRK